MSDERISLRLPPTNRGLEQMLNWGTSNAIPFPQGQHTSNGAEEKTPDTGRMQAKRAAAPTGGKSAQEKRFRDSNWEDDEKTDLLVGKVRFLVFCMLQRQGLSTSTFKDGKSWSHVSEQLGRAAKSCQHQWDSLVKFRKAICDHESKPNSGTVRHVSFWEMSEHEIHVANEERRIAKLVPLPLVFPRLWYELMEIIFQIDAVKKTLCSRKVDGTPPSSSTAPIASAITDSDDSPPGPSDGAVRSSQLPSSSCHGRSSMDPSPLSLVSNQGVEDEVLAMSDDDLFSIIGPFVTKRIADDLKAQVIPLLRRQEETEQKYHHEKLLAIETEKLNLKRKEMALFEDVLTPLLPFLRSRQEDKQKHREQLLALEAEKVALKRDELVVKRDNLAVKREKMLLMISPLATTSMAHVAPASGEALNIDMANIAPEHSQQANYIQTPSNEDFSSPDGTSFLQILEDCSWSYH